MFMPNLGVTFHLALLESREYSVGKRGSLLQLLYLQLFCTKQNKGTTTLETLFVTNYFRARCNQLNLYPVANKLLRRLWSYGTWLYLPPGFLFQF